MIVLLEMIGVGNTILI